MDTIKYYTCECGEEFFKNDTECMNCGKPADWSKFKEETLPEIISQGEVGEVVFPRTKD